SYSSGVPYLVGERFEVSLTATAELHDLVRGQTVRHEEIGGAVVRDRLDLVIAVGIDVEHIVKGIGSYFAPFRSVGIGVTGILRHINAHSAAPLPGRRAARPRGTLDAASTLERAACVPRRGHRPTPR